MLSREFRISRSEEYNNIYKKGKKITGKYIIMYIASNNKNINRFGIVASKKVGNAVVRNRAKRLIRACVQNGMENFRTGNDIIVIARYNINQASQEMLDKDLKIGMRKAGLI